MIQIVGLTAGGIAFLVSLLLIPVMKRLSQRFNVLDVPRRERWHRTPTPRLGGVAMFLAFAAGMIYGLLRTGSLRWELLLGPGLVFALGLFDDLRELSPPAKLVGQILAAAVVVSFGNVIDFFDWTVPNVVLTFLWVVGITNAINLLDNMDGLAGGVGLIAAVFLSYFFWNARSPSLLIPTLALFGAVLGFLLYNFPPASIFMGDSGSLFLGYTLASISIARTARASNLFAVMGVPTLLFLLPILDTLLVTVTRILRGQSPVQGDSDHTSHRLVAFGLSERQALLVLYGIAVFSGVVGTVFESLDYALSLVLVPLLLVSFAILAAYLGRLKVVSAYGQPPQGTITRLVVELTFKRRILEILLDFMLISLAFYLAFWTRFGFSLDDAALDLVFRSLPVALPIIYLSYFLLGIYRGLWRYVGLDELVRYARAVLVGAGLTAAALLLLFPAASFSPVIFFLFAVFLLLSLVASRFSFRVLDRIYGRQQAQRGRESNILIYGAGDAGEMALRWILRNPELGYHPVGFLDGDPYKQGRRIHGVDVLGGLESLEAILAEKKIDGLILTPSEGDQNELLSAALKLSRSTGVWVRRLRFEFELLE